LKKNRALYPFAVTMSETGEIAHLHADGGPELASDGVLELLVSGLRESASTGELLAIAIVHNINLTDRKTGTRTDAISL
jgi:hypothetical protein